MCGVNSIPITAGSTALNAVFLDPEIWVKQLGYRYEETIQDALTGEWYTEDTRAAMLRRNPPGWSWSTRCRNGDGSTG